MPAIFPKSMRLTKKLEFDAVYRAKMRRTRGPVTIYSRLNGLPHHRLGLSVGRIVGAATRRNRIKRLFREAFRLHQHALKSASIGLDLIVSVKPHDFKHLDDYAALLNSCVLELAEAWMKREAGR
jgi:ribonuclease P protein component